MHYKWHYEDLGHVTKGGWTEGCANHFERIRLHGVKQSMREV